MEISSTGNILCRKFAISRSSGFLTRDAADKSAIVQTYYANFMHL